MTTAINPSPWYGALVSYKKFHRQRGQVLASVAHHFLANFSEQIEELLGDAPSAITMVPSKQPGVTFQNQPLRKSLALVEPIRAQLREALTFVEGAGHGRHAYTPAAFAPGPFDVEGERVLLIEDTWVTGATVISAAGALLEHGAAAVVVLPIARVINDSFMSEDDPYRAAMSTPYDADDRERWPR
jgi:hypothetical protein